MCNIKGITNSAGKKKKLKKPFLLSATNIIWFDNYCISLSCMSYVEF